MTYEDFAIGKIGEAIKIAMTERKINIQQLEKASGVSRTIIYKILKGQNYNITSLISVMRILQMHLELSLLDADHNIWADNKGPINLN